MIPPRREPAVEAPKRDYTTLVNREAANPPPRPEKGGTRG